MKKAKAAGDEKRVKELEAQGPAGQELVHKQSFGTWSVDNILDKIKGKISKIAKQADVDVTDLMVQPFDPDESTLKVIQEVLKRAPVPLEKLKNHKH